MTDSPAAHLPALARQHRVQHLHPRLLHQRHQQLVHLLQPLLQDEPRLRVARAAALQQLPGKRLSDPAGCQFLHRLPHGPHYIPRYLFGQKVLSSRDCWT